MKPRNIIVTVTIEAQSTWRKKEIEEAVEDALWAEDTGHMAPPDTTNFRIRQIKAAMQVDQDYREPPALLAGRKAGRK